MLEHIGEVFTGVVSGVTNWGIYVELPNTIEGMVPLSKLAGDFYVYDEAMYEVRGKATGITYKLGQAVNVIVTGVDKVTRTIDFMIYDEEDGE